MSTGIILASHGEFAKAALGSAEMLAGEQKDVHALALTTMLNSLLDDPGIDEVFWNTPACEELRTIISFKLKGILYVLGLLIGECCGIHPSPESGTFFIYLVGGGSQAYRLANGGFNSSAYDMLAELPKLQFPAYENFGTMRDRFAIKPSNSPAAESGQLAAPVQCRKRRRIQ